MASFPRCKAVYFPLDVTDDVASKSCIDKILSEFGKIDVVVPNAGVNLFRPFIYTPLDDWWRIMDVNVRAPLLLTQLVLKTMRERNEGAIIYISSRAGVVDLGIFFAVLREAVTETREQLGPPLTALQSEYAQTVNQRRN